MKRKTEVHKGYPIITEEDGSINWIRGFTPVYERSVEDCIIQIDKVIGHD